MPENVGDTALPNASSGAVPVAPLPNDVPGDPVPPAGDPFASLDLERPGAPGSHPAFDDLVRIIWRLRQPDGCPWDRKQTHASIAQNMIEEAYEAVDAIEEDASLAQGIAPVPSPLAPTDESSLPAASPAPARRRTSTRHLAEELGDVLMQVVLHAQIAADEGAFTIDDVAQGIATKLVRRHPHVFGDAAASSAEDVRSIWERVKLAEHGAESDEARGAGEDRPGLLDSVPIDLPALMACQKISRKAVAAGFDWDTTEDVWEQVASEVAEFKAAVPGSREAEVEFGDILFSLVNVARRCGIDAESALRASNAKFRARWSSMEHDAWAQGRELAELDREQQEALWVAAKLKEKVQ